MKNFSFTDYLYRQAFGQTVNNDRGKAEVEAMNEATKCAPYDFDHSFSMRAMRDLTVGVDSAGGYTVADNVSNNFEFGNFYQESYFLSNATILENLSSNVSIPSKSTAAVLTSGAVLESTPSANTYSTEFSFSQTKLTPHHIRVTIEVSQQLLEQTKSYGSGNLVLNEIQNSLSEELDRQLFKGDSTANEITGIVNTTGINSDTWGDLSSLTGASAASKTIASEKSLGDAKIPLPQNWIINSETRAKFRSLRQAGLSYPILNERNEILGYPTEINENLEDGDCWFVAPSNVILGLFHGSDVIDLIVDGRSKFNSGIVILTASLMADAALIRPQALSILSES